MAFPSVQEAIESANPTTAATTHTVALPTATAGQLLVIISDKGSTAATVNAHASLTELLDENSANGLYVAYRFMDGTEPASYDLVTSASTRLASIAYRISDARLVAPGIGTTGSGTSATPDPPSSGAPGSTQDYLFIAFAGMAGEEADDDTWGNTPPTNYTPSPPRQKSCGTVGVNLGGLILSAERQLNTGAAEDPGTFGVDVSAAWRSQTLTIQPAMPQSVTPGVASLTLTAFAPTVTVTNNTLVTPGTANLTLTAFAPTVAAPRLVTPGAASLTLTAFAPSVATPRLVTPGAAALTTTTFAPTVTVAPTGGGTTVTPGTASLTLTTFAPSVIAPRVVTPGVRALALTSFAPSVIASDHKLVTPGAASVALTAFAPTVSAGVPIVTGGLPPGGLASSHVPGGRATSIVPRGTSPSSTPGGSAAHPTPAR